MTESARAPMQMGHVIDGMLQRLPMEHRVKVLTQASEAKDLLNQLDRELTIYFLSIADQEQLDAEGFQQFRAQLVACRSLVFALAGHGNNFRKGNHPLLKNPGAGLEDNGPIGG
jgi:hypothetical protein